MLMFSFEYFNQFIKLQTLSTTTALCSFSIFFCESLTSEYIRHSNVSSYILIEFANSANFNFQLVHRGRTDLLRVCVHQQWMREKDPIHYSKVILDQFIPRPLVRLGIFSYHHLQIRQVRYLDIVLLRFVGFSP
jgi:hypothetical protein